MKSLRKFGAEAIMMFNQDTIDEKVEVFSSGSYLLNNALGIGGYPKGRIVEIYGPESSGKTTLCLHAIAEVQKQGGIVCFYWCWTCYWSTLCKKFRNWFKYSYFEPTRQWWAGYGNCWYFS
nr:hypothetical protein [Mycoplasmopsis bovis]